MIEIIQVLLGVAVVMLAINGLLCWRALYKIEHRLDERITVLYQRLRSVENEQNDSMFKVHENWDFISLHPWQVIKLLLDHAGLELKQDKVNRTVEEVVLVPRKK